MNAEELDELVKKGQERLRGVEDKIEAEERVNPDAAAVQKPITLIITYDQRTGNLQLTGPLENKLLMYGLLELAKDATRANHEELVAKRAASGIVPAFMVPPKGVRLP